MIKLNYQKPAMKIRPTYAESNLCTGTIPIPGSGTVVTPWAKESTEEEDLQVEVRSVWDE